MFDTPEQISPAVARAPRRQVGRAVPPLTGEGQGRTVRPRVQATAQASVAQATTAQASTVASHVDATNPDDSAVEDAYQTFWSDLGIFLVVIVLSVLIARSQGFA